MKFNIENLKKSKAVIFDMDGLLVDSEPLWQKAEISVFKKTGINLQPKECEKYQGIRIEEVVPMLFEKYNLKNKKVKVVVNEVVSKMLRLLKSVKILPGVLETINYYYNKNVKIAVASSSKMVMINQVIDRMEIRDKIDVLHSAEFEKAGKPKPDIFLTTAKLLKTDVNDCLIFEDSVFGVQAAKNAKMKVVAIPHYQNFDNKQFNKADLKIMSMNDWLKILKS